MAYDTLLDCLTGKLRYAEAPSTVYAAKIKDHPDHIKLGFCQLTTRNRRFSDPWLTETIYESCKDEEMRIMSGDLSRCDAFVVEQWLLQELEYCREQIPALMEEEWSGRFETLRIPEKKQASFARWLEQEVNWRVMSNKFVFMLEDLVTSAAEQAAFEPIKAKYEAGVAKRKKSVAAILKKQRAAK